MQTLALLSLSLVLWLISSFLPAQAAGLGNVGRVRTESGSEGFLASGELSRGEAYDREVYPRDYLGDLLQRGLYGPVVRLNGDSPLPPGLQRQGSVFRAAGELVLKPDTIYFIKGQLSVGQGVGDQVFVGGGRARIVVEGDIEILSNVLYRDVSGSELDGIPSLRLHSLGDIRIHPAVTELELMMLAEEGFYSGAGDQQLRILGDVIAKHAHWERRPLNSERKLEERVNKPSELVIEDVRKYVVPPPGDQMLVDQHLQWREMGVDGEEVLGWIRGKKSEVGSR